MRKKKGEVILKGNPISEGIAIGAPVFLFSEEEKVPEFPITVHEVEAEIDRYRRALSSSREDLRNLQANLLREGSNEVVSIINTHIEMLDDPLMTTHVEKKIREMLKNTESVFSIAMSDYEVRLSHAPDPFFRHRLLDIRDISSRVLRKLSTTEGASLKEIPPNSIIFTKELVPSETASLEPTGVLALVTLNGGKMSHTALVARSKGIVYVLADVEELFNKMQGKHVIVDGRTGDIIVNPHPTTLKKYEQLKERFDRQALRLEAKAHLPAKTKDGLHFAVYANVSGPEEMPLLLKNGGAGVGLFRSEYLFLNHRELFFDEEAQYDLYRRMVLEAKGLPIVFRVMDIGGDKHPDLLNVLPKEQHSAFNSRGIHFLLKRKDFFRTQLRALMRAALLGEIKILLPLITGVDELFEAKTFIESVRKELGDFPALSVGSMLETPAAILDAAGIIGASDFVALGTNDLMRYTLASPSSHASDSESSVHPSILKLILLAVQEADRQQKPLSLCGEMGSNPAFIPLLIGLGIRNFSCAPRFIPLVKKAIRSASHEGAQKLAEAVLELKSAAEIVRFLEPGRSPQP